MSIAFLRTPHAQCRCNPMLHSSHLFPWIASAVTAVHCGNVVRRAERPDARVSS